MANVIKHKRGSGSDPVASDLVVGEVAIRTDVGKLFTKMDNGSVAEIAGGGSDIAINTLSSSSGTGGGSATFNGSAYRFTLSAPPSVSAQQLLVSINGVIQKPVAGTGQPSEGFSVDGTDIILGDAPATGSDFFILTFKSLGVSEPADNSVTSAKIVNGTIVTADLADDAITSAKIADNAVITDLLSASAVNTAKIANSAVTDAKIADNAVITAKLSASAVTTAKIANNAINNAKVASDAAIAGTKISPDFGSQNLVTTGDLTVDTNTLHVDSSNNRVGIGTTSPDSEFHVLGGGTVATFEGTGGSSSIGIKDSDDGTIAFAVVDAGKFKIQTSGSSYSDKLVIDTSGNVGIGTTTPDTLLHLAGADTAVIRLENTDTTLGTDQIIGGIEFEKQDATGAGVGIAGAIRLKSMSSVGQAASMFFSTSNSSGNDQTKMTLDFDGKVGIGTTSPEDLLHIKSGKIRIENTIVSNNDSTISYDNTDFIIDVDPNNARGSSKFQVKVDTVAGLTVDDNRNVGIGTTSPNRTLHQHVNNSGANYHQFTNSACGTGDGDGSFVGIDSGEDLIVWNQEVNAIRLATSNLERMRIDSSGRVLVGLTSTSLSSAIVAETSISGGGQGVITAIDSSSNDFGCGLVVGKNTTTTSSSQRFVQFYSDTLSTVMGGIVGNGANSVQFASISDERLKKNIKPLSGILEKINKIKTVSFDWKDINESVKAGFIAQNVQEIFPEYVVDNMANEGEEKKLGTTGGMAGGYIAVLTAAIQELSAKIEALEAK